MTADILKFDLFTNFTKVGDDHTFEGIASTNKIDNQGGEWRGQKYVGDLITIDALKAALPGYMAWGNIREMHEASAVGTTVDASFVGNVLKVVGRIVDPMAWLKVKEGVYKGLSIGGRVIDAVVKMTADGIPYRLITALELVEISLVDRPANSDARILLWKGANMPDQAASTQAAAETPVLDVDKIRKAFSAAREAAKAAGVDTAVIEKAAVDPKKLVVMIQQLRNDAEGSGDMDDAQLYTQAISLIQQAAGAADKASDAADTSDASTAGGDTSTQASGGAVTAAQRATDLKKVGRTFSGNNVAAMHSVIQTLAGLLAKSGEEKGQKILEVYTLGKVANVTSPNIADELVKGLTPVFNDIAKNLQANEASLQKLMSQPAPGGPVTRVTVVDKTTLGQQAADAATINKREGESAEPTIDQQVFTLEKMQGETNDSFMKSKLGEQIARLRIKQGRQLG